MERHIEAIEEAIAHDIHTIEHKLHEEFNPQPDPPGKHPTPEFNPQPDPPGKHPTPEFNPQPDPPGRQRE